MGREPTDAMEGQPSYRRVTLCAPTGAAAGAGQGCVSREPGPELRLPHVQNSLSWHFQAVQLFIRIRNSLPVFPTCLPPL